MYLRGRPSESTRAANRLLSFASVERPSLNLKFPEMVRENTEKLIGSTPEEGTRYTAFRCPEDLLELAKIKARKDRRSLSNYIIMLIAKDVEEPPAE
jgi:hypothetical protein